MWDELEKEGEFRVLAVIGKKFCVIAASEATVKSSFSLAKRFLSTRQSSKSDLLDAYLALLPNNDEKSETIHEVIEKKDEEPQIQSKTKSGKQQSVKNYFSPIPK